MKYLSDADHSILELLYHYGLVWQNDMEPLLKLARPRVSERLKHIESLGYVHSQRLPGERRRNTWGLTDAGFCYMKEGFSYPGQYIENYDLRFTGLSRGFIRHECLISHAASRFKAEEGSSAVVHDRRSLLAHLPGDAKQNRTSSKIRPMEIRSHRAEASHRTDDILYIQRAGQRPTALFIEVDRGTESARDRHGRPRGKVSKMFDFYLDAYRENYYRRYFGREVKPLVLFLITTAWNGSTRKQNFIDLWQEVSQGRAENLPRFMTLGEFDAGDPLAILHGWGSRGAP